jgi:hypothetical protein
MVNVFGINLPDLPYALIGSSLCLIATIGKMIIERDELFNEENRRRFPWIIGLLLVTAYSAVADGIISSETLPLGPELLFGFGMVFLALGCLMDLAFAPG